MGALLSELVGIFVFVYFLIKPVCQSIARHSFYINAIERMYMVRTNSEDFMAPIVEKEDPEKEKEQEGNADADEDEDANKADMEEFSEVAEKAGKNHFDQMEYIIPYKPTENKILAQEEVINQTRLARIQAKMKANKEKEEAEQK